MNTKSDTLFGHPRGLMTLFMTEMWERFSFYGMRALLVLYMTKYLFIDGARMNEVYGLQALSTFLVSMHGEMDPKALASHVYGIYTFMAYATPILGGILADQFLGQRKAVYLGGSIMALGHFLMGVENMFLVALLCIALGNGCFKPNISTQVGRLYKDGDPRRDGAFTLFYMGINLGAFLAPLVCGSLGQKVGWHYGFTAAGFGMIIGLLIYHFNRHTLAPDQLARRSKTKPEPLSRDDIFKMLGLLMLFPITIGFWIMNEQQGNTLQLWADERTNWNVLGWEVPSSWFQSFNPAMVFIFAPILDMWWKKRGNQGASSIMKMGWGCLLAGLSFGVVLIALKLTPVGEKTNMLWITFATFLLTMGELYLSPIGLSLVSKLAHQRFTSMMMGFWFLSIALGGYFAGWFGSLYSTISEERFFQLLMAMGFSAASLFFFAHFRMRDWFKGA